MHVTSLRKVGGSIMLAVPPAILDLLHLEVGQRCGSKSMESVWSSIPT